VPRADGHYADCYAVARQDAKACERDCYVDAGCGAYLDTYVVDTYVVDTCGGNANADGCADANAYGPGNGDGSAGASGLAVADGGTRGGSPQV
jgi:hypothetical protein